MPFVRITIVREAIADDATGKKAAITRKVAAAIADATNLPEHEVSIVFDEIAAADWYVGTEVSKRCDSRANRGAGVDGRSRFAEAG